jgi:hypothetical protein
VRAKRKKDGAWLEFGSSPGGHGRRSDLEDFKSAVKQGMLTLRQIHKHHSEVYARYTHFCMEYIQDKYIQDNYKEQYFNSLRAWKIEKLVEFE